MTPLPHFLTEAEPTTMSEHVLRDEECMAITNRLDVLPVPSKIHDYMRAAYNLGIERGKEERREFICARCGIRQDSKPSGESPF